MKIGDMMADSQEFSYVSVRNTSNEASLRPLLPITLQYNDLEREATGLLDTGADVNVLPYHLGLALGGIWDAQQTAVQLSGNLAHYEARGIILNAIVGSFAPVRLAFAWTRAEDVPLILGQVNFFMVYDVCFYRSHNTFDITPAQG